MDVSVNQNRLLSAATVREYLKLAGLSDVIAWPDDVPLFWTDLHALVAEAQLLRVHAPEVAKSPLKAFGFDQTNLVRRLLRHAIP